MSESFIVGLDIGQVSDYTALAVLRRNSVLPATSAYDVVHLHRFPLGTLYTGTPLNPGIGEQFKELINTPPLPGCQVAVDQTGVGRAVVDSLRVLGLPASLWPITITAGQNAAAAEDGGLRVPKVDLVACLQMLLQGGRLRIAKALPLSATLERELAAFRVKITQAGNETYGAWRDADHDDLVLAVALACWLAERCPDFTSASIGMGQRGAVAQPPRGVSMGGDFRRWPRGV